MNKSETLKSLQSAQIQSRAAWKVVGALCSIYGINNDYRDSENFYNILVRKCLDEAQKEIESAN